ncbi:unnamed protein product [Timema podura]|uniref:Uncharacterized protein n=1 Tax=Timema podura TaxID=61482 RepID=A0ABN7P8Y1_TIMPD|nr:unnamed protein product [Timema podura]
MEKNRYVPGFVGNMETWLFSLLPSYFQDFILCYGYTTTPPLSIVKKDTSRNENLFSMKESSVSNSDMPTLERASLYIPTCQDCFAALSMCVVVALFSYDAQCFLLISRRNMRAGKCIKEKRIQLPRALAVRVATTFFVTLGMCEKEHETLTRICDSHHSIACSRVVRPKVPREGVEVRELPGVQYPRHDPSPGSQSAVTARPANHRRNGSHCVGWI